MEYDLNGDEKLDQLDYSIADVGFFFPLKGCSFGFIGSLLPVYLGSYLLCQWIVKSRLGKVLLAIRDDEPTLHFFGYKPHIYKIFAFCIAAALAGIAGMLFVPQMKIVTPSNMEAYRSVLVVVWVAVGGRSSLGGAVWVL